MEGKCCGNVPGSVASAIAWLSAWTWLDTKSRFYGVSSSAGFSLLCDVMLSVSVIFITPSFQRARGVVPSPTYLAPENVSVLFGSFWMTCDII